MFEAREAFSPSRRHYRQKLLYYFIPLIPPLSHFNDGPSLAANTSLAYLADFR